MEGHLREDRYTEALVAAIDRVGAVLAAHFPRRPDDSNELADESPWLILRKQIFQIRLGQAAGEAFFAEDVGDGLRFALLQFPNLFLDRSR